MFRSRLPRLFVLVGAAALVVLLAGRLRRAGRRDAAPPAPRGDDAVASEPVTSDADTPVETADPVAADPVDTADLHDAAEPTMSARVYQMSAPPVVEETTDDPAPQEPVAEETVVGEAVADEIVEDVADPVVEASEPSIDLDRIERDLEGVEAALRRLDDGSYWTDEITGEPLDDALLVADPVARRNVA